MPTKSLIRVQLFVTPWTVALSGSSVHGFGLGKVSFLLACMPAKSLSRVQLFVTPWTVALQAPLSMSLSRQEYWRGLPCPPPGDLPDPGVKPASLMFPALLGGFFTTSVTWEAQDLLYSYINQNSVVLVEQ